MLGTEGKHIILDMWGVDASKLRQIKFVKNAILKAAEYSQATILHKKIHRFEPEGVSGYVMIAESHISIHTWPSDGYASTDIYTCGDRTFPLKAAKFLLHELAPKKYDIFQILRGDKDGKRMRLFIKDEVQGNE